MKFIDNWIDRWKEEWLNRNEYKLSQQFESDLSELKDIFESTKSDLSKKINEIESKKFELDILSKTLDNQKQDILLKESELRKQISALNQRYTPETAFLEGFSQGVSKTWDSIYPIIYDQVIKSKKLIYDLAVEETLNNNPQWKSNGHNKKNY